MRKALHAAAAFSAAMIAGLALSGCPMQPTYPSTITPIYAAAGAGGLWVYNGTSWTNHAQAGANAVVVSGSGAGALAYVGDSAGVSLFDGTAWTALTGGLGAVPVNRLFLGSNLFAATSGGVSILNGIGPIWWTNDPTAGSANDVFSLGVYTLVAANAGLEVYYGTSLVSTTSPGTIVGTSTTATALFVDSAGDLLVGTNKGLAVQYAGKTAWISLLPTATVNQIAMDQSGNLYVATSNGLYILTTSTVLALPGAVWCVCVDGAGRIYAGTGSGLQVSTNGGSSWTLKLSTTTPILSVTTTAPLYSF